MISAKKGLTNGGESCAHPERPAECCAAQRCGPPACTRVVEWHVLSWVCRAAVLLLPACFHPIYDHPACGPHGECPSGFSCSAALVCESGSSVNAPDAMTGNPDGGGVCGDGVKTGSKQCDDGNLVPYDGCSPTCM